MLEIVVCDDDMADLECAVTMLHTDLIIPKPPNITNNAPTI